MATTELKRTISSAGSQTKWGASAWVKLLGVGTSISQPVYCSSKSDTTGNLRGIFITSDDKIQVGYYDSGYSFQVETNRRLRDPSAFYHLCVAFDSSQSTANDRIKIWVNGVQETSMATNSQPSINGTYNFFGTDITQLVGSLREGSTICNPCVISHLHVTDGYCYPASSYGSTDATTGEWKIETSPSVSYGTNGFFVLKDDAALTDRSGQGNDLTLGSGTITKTEDCPDNVFATINPLYKHSATYANGNLKSTNASNKFGGVSSIGVSTGKYYAEFKYGSASNQNGAVGIYGNPQVASNNNQGVGKEENSYSYRSDDGNKVIENTGSAYGNTFASGNIISIALDLDNNKLYFAKDGVWQNSGDPTSGSTGTGAIDISLTPTDGCWFIAANCNSASDTAVWEHNYGNGYFGTTAISSEGTNASGIGKFEYDVPTGYTALSTKGLNE